MSKSYKFGTVQAIRAEFVAPEEEGKKPYVEVDLKVVDSDQFPEIVGKVVKDTYSLSGGAVKYTMEALRCLGWSCNDVTELTGVGDTKARGGVYLDTYNGKTREKCSIWPIKARAKVDGKAKKSFAAQFKQAAAAVNKVEVTDANKAIDREAFPEAPPQLPDEFSAPDQQDDFDPFAAFND